MCIVMYRQTTEYYIMVMLLQIHNNNLVQNSPLQLLSKWKSHTSIYLINDVTADWLIPNTALFVYPVDA